MNEREPFAKPIDVLRSRLAAYIDMSSYESSPLSPIRSAIDELEWAIDVLERATAPEGNGTEVVVEARIVGSPDRVVRHVARLIPVLVEPS